MVLPAAGGTEKDPLFPQAPDLPQRFGVDRRFLTMQQRTIYITGHQPDHLLVPPFCRFTGHIIARPAHFGYFQLLFLHILAN